MSNAQAIKQKCLDCSGGAPKEVTLCLIVQCPIWPYRCGYSLRDKRYKERMEATEKKYPKEYQELLEELSRNKEKQSNSSENEQIDDFKEDIAM